jgi:hypothetical protein
VSFLGVQNPFILAVGLMNLGACLWYASKGSTVMAAALLCMAVGAAIQSFAVVN